MSEQTADPLEVQDTSTTEAPAPADVSSLMPYLEELTSKVDSLVPQQEQGPSFSEAVDPAYDPWGGFQQETQEPQFEQPGQYDQGQGDPNQALQWIQDQINQGVQAAVTPFMAQTRARELESQYPDLQKPEIVQSLIPHAQRLAQAMGTPNAWNNPDLLLMVYQAQTGQQTASQQTAADEQPGMGLEAGGAQQPSADEPNQAERLLNAWGNSDERSFWGA